MAQAALADPQKAQKLEKQYEDLKKSVEKRQKELQDQRNISRNRLLTEDDSGDEAALENVPSNDVEMKDVEAEESDSDQEAHISAEFLLRKVKPRSSTVQDVEDEEMEDV